MMKIQIFTKKGNPDLLIRVAVFEKNMSHYVNKYELSGDEVCHLFDSPEIKTHETCTHLHILFNVYESCNWCKFNDGKNMCIKTNQEAKFKCKEWRQW